jgi:CHRD domain
MALRLGGVCALALVWALQPALAAEQFETRLSSSPLTDGTRVNISGEGRAHATLDGNTLTITADFHGLGSAATTAELYDGPGIGIPGPKAFDLTASQGTSGTVSGSVSLTSKQVAAVRHGHFYVQINSQKAPTGNLTGWLLPPHADPGQDVPVAGPGFLPQFDVPAK